VSTVDADEDDVTTARAIVDANLYMTLATADAAGRPWPTPVFFAPVSYRELVWVSRPDARHSRNIAGRPEVGVVVFDSQAPISTGRAVYLTARAGLVPAADLDRCVAVFSRSAQERGGGPWSVDDVGPTARLRLYRAVASEQWVLDDRDRRVPVPLGLAAP
jgi:nitroimidazol reductase NimA-like FMN-containing flavoprotein (pyridoxamine 5'-phosphate oxidase superfamily)